MTPATASPELVTLLQDKATRLRIHSVLSTSAAGSGHPTSCASAAEIMATLFFSVMRYDPQQPGNKANDAFVLSKGHAAPILYAAWAEAGLYTPEQLLTLRKLNSDLEGHPTPRLPYVDAATGSLGQGLSVAAGIAANALLIDKTDQRVYVLMGDGESAEGSCWEAAQTASVDKLGNLTLVIDVNRLGQSQPTMLQHHMDVYKARWESFGWEAMVVDGHSVEALLAAFAQAEQTKDRPTVILAQTYKGHGLPKVENAEGAHGKALDMPVAQEIAKQLGAQLKDGLQWEPKLPTFQVKQVHPPASVPGPTYELGGKEVAPRRAFGDALAAIGKVDERVVVIDGDVKNSTYTDAFEKVAPGRFFESYIAEQNMVGMAMGFGSHGKIPVASTFACFFSRAYDFMRMAAIGSNNIKIAGTHVGVSIGEDGPSQMGLEDLAMACAQPNYTVLYPSDATSTWRATELMINTPGPVYLRLGRPNAPIVYSKDEQFTLGQSKTLRESGEDKVLVVAGGVTLFEALKAYDQLKAEGISIRVVDIFCVQPIDKAGLTAAAKACGGNVITVEDHYAHGGLGDAVLGVLASERVNLHKIAVREIPHSGEPQELIEHYNIAAKDIVAKVKELVQ